MWATPRCPAFCASGVLHLFASKRANSAAIRTMNEFGKIGAGTNRNLLRKIDVSIARATETRALFCACGSERSASEGASDEEI